jgi:hypothetical protein
MRVSERLFPEKTGVGVSEVSREDLPSRQAASPVGRTLREQNTAVPLLPEQPAFSPAAALEHQILGSLAFGL